MNKLKIHQIAISDNHLDSFWYQGLIAEYGDVCLYALGEIEGIFQETKMTGDAIAQYVFNDGDSGLDAIDFIDSNWFEIVAPDGVSFFVEEQNYNQALKELVMIANDLETEKENL